MKNHILCLLLLCFFGVSTAFGQVSFGVKGGVTFADGNVELLGEDLETDMITTFHIGPIVEIKAGEVLGVNAALLYAGRGYQADVAGVEVQRNVYYLQVPLNLVFDADIFYFSGGPYVGFAVGGKNTDGDNDTDLEFGSSADDDLGASDFGINVELGVNLNQLRLGVGYGLGLSNNLPADFKDANDNVSFKNNAINVSATYFFGAQ